VSPAAYENDHTLAQHLLRGRHDAKKDFVYLSGEDERQARKALVRLLLADAPLSMRIRRRLAALFDPEPPVTPHNQAQLDAWETAPRLIVFRGRTNRRRKHFARDANIGAWMQNEWLGGASLKEARRRASKEFKLSDKKLKDIWSETKSFRAHFLSNAWRPPEGVVSKVTK
jgi:hypothetical protein